MRLDNRGQFQVIVASMVVLSLLSLRIIAHISGTPEAIAAAVVGGAGWQLFKRKTGAGL